MIVAISLSLLSQRAAAQTNVTWQGGNGASYGTAANWNPQVVPFNDGPSLYNVFIPTNQSVLMDVDGAHQITDLTLAAGATLTVAPGESLTVVDDAHLSGNLTTAGGTFAATGLGAQFEGSGFQLSVSGSGTISVNASNYVNTLSDVRADRTLLSSSGAGSTLNLSGVQTFASPSYGYRDSGGWTYDVKASNNGVIDLSGVTSVTGARNDVSGDNRYDRSYLRFRMETGGAINLNSLISTTERTWFDVQTPSYTLPNLETTSHTAVTVGGGSTFNAPKLRTMSNRGTSLSIGANATFNAPLLTGVNAFDEDQTGWSGGVIVGTGATLHAPGLKSLNNVSLTWAPNRTFNHSLTNIDGSEVAVIQGATLNLAGVTTYNNTLGDYRADLTLLSSDGAGSTLNLSGVQTFASPSYGYRDSGGWTYDVKASNNGVIDLSGVTSVTGARSDASSDNRYNQSWLRFRMETGGAVDLSSLASTSGRVWFDVAELGILQLGNLAVTNNARFELRQITSKVEASGSLFLNGTSQFLMADGAQVDVGGDFLFQYTDETRMQFDRGRLHLNGSGIQYLEAGGTDNDVAGAAANNFGIGRLEVGADGSPTTVHVIDLFNNGNRGTIGQEALYLGGIAGLDGLLIHPGSTLVLNDVNIYARIGGVMTLLNSMVPAGAMAVELGSGFLALQQPLEGDYNFDGNVDGTDMLMWQRGLGSSVSLAADGNHNGVVDAGDLAVWGQNFGRSLAALTSTQTAVPEPSTISAVLSAGMLLVAVRARRNSRVRIHLI